MVAECVWKGGGVRRSALLSGMLSFLLFAGCSGNDAPVDPFGGVNSTPMASAEPSQTASATQAPSASPTATISATARTTATASPQSSPTPSDEPTVMAPTASPRPTPTPTMAVSTAPVDTVVPTAAPCVDEDGDGSCSDGGSGPLDCDDADAAVHPEALEACNAIDDDCDDTVDEDTPALWYLDADGDGDGDPETGVAGCPPPIGYVRIGSDCDDDDDTRAGVLAETCDGQDNDCDEAADEGLAATWFADSDGDGFGNPASGVETCDPEAGYVDNGSDCDDGEAEAFPGNSEVCDGLDNNCDGAQDEGLDTLWYADADGDLYGAADDTTLACAKPSGHVSRPGDCDDEASGVYPGAAEATNLGDDDCDGDIDEGVESASCLAILESFPDATDGAYTLDPDGSPLTPALGVWCDMQTEEGGWTLISQAVPVSEPSLDLCTDEAVGSLDVDGTTVRAPAKLSDADINLIWSGARELLIKTEVESGEATRDGWETVCSVDFAATYDWRADHQYDLSLGVLDSTEVVCSTGSWGDGDIDGITGAASTFCGFRFYDDSTGALNTAEAHYLIYSSTDAYVGGSCGNDKVAGRSWLSTGNFGCNVTQYLVR